MKDRRRDLRKRQTDVERLLWSRLRGSQVGFKFKRQHSFGPYVLDFYCASKQLAIELDGGQHTEEKQCDYDNFRTEFLKSLGVRVIRFWNNQVSREIDGVIEEITRELRSPSPAKEREG